MKTITLSVGTWFAAGMVAFAAMDEVRISIWCGVAASFLIFVSVVEGRER